MPPETHDSRGPGERLQVVPSMVKNASKDWVPVVIAFSA